MRASRRVLGPAAVVAVLAVVGCGSSNPASRLLPGHASPAAAALGFLQAATANRGSEACSYVAPAQGSACSAAFSSGTSAISVRNLHIGATTVSGDRALVTALGTLCTNTTGRVCFDNTHTSAGQPDSTNTFDVAYSAVESGSSPNNDPAIPCTRVNGQWYVDPGESSSSTIPPTTTTPHTPG